MNEISAHITWKEATFSLTAIRLGIDNTPIESELMYMRVLAEKVFELVRIHFGKPIHISSFFRCRKLNSAVGGSISSQHLAHNGAAMDIDNESPTNKEIFEYIKEHLIFDQIISEFPDEQGNPSWVHVSYNERANRNEILISEKIEGRIFYKTA